MNTCTTVWDGRKLKKWAKSPVIRMRAAADDAGIIMMMMAGYGKEDWLEIKHGGRLAGEIHRSGLLWALVIVAGHEIMELGLVICRVFVIPVV